MTRQAGLVVVNLLLVSIAANAQSLGVFRWQLQPYCNVITLAITQNGGVYRLEGTDDQCGAARVAAATGTAYVNPDGSVGFGLTIVAAPEGSPVHVDAAINVATLSGSWRDSVGSSGSFVLTPSIGTGGSPRPTSRRLGISHVDPSQVQARVLGACPAGQAMQSIGETGTVACGAVGGGTITAVSAGAGLSGGGTSGTVALALQTTASGSFDLSNPAGVVSTGQIGTGTIPVSGPGVRTMWVPGRAAFRAGEVSGAQWDIGAIGLNSTAFGLDPVATGSQAFAIGSRTTASGQGSTAMGVSTVASGVGSIALGLVTNSTNEASVALGAGTWARGRRSFAMGLFSEANGDMSVAIGYRAHANGDSSVSLGTEVNSLTTGYGTFMFGDSSSPTPMIGGAPNQFLVRAAGGTAFYSNSNLATGVSLAPGGGSWQNASDATLKENFRDLAGELVLGKLAQMPFREWNYTSQDTSIRHVGPTAQDFHAAFELGENPLRINTVDADGIALRAIQALEARTSELRRDNETLRAELAALRVLVLKITSSRD